ncbi:VanZ family protein [Salipaludibacillus daqingensis]|uniref:VanZ family protein n=1 Tax=Salipaludibacillus daqingensis TaxID=3041001 RepID=UPI0024765FC9|nr:VanZ family protein [Salipaludibacillus daqingensis]
MIDQEFFHNWATLFLIMYIVFDLIRNRKKERSLVMRLVFYSFIYYMINVVKLTLLPIMFIPFAVSVQLVPFYFVVESINIGYIPRAYIENFILLLPFGLYLPLLFERFRKLKLTIITAFLLSLSIETIQLLMGLTFGSHRTFNVDDMILNTSGTLIGYLFYKIWFILIEKYKSRFLRK